MKLQLTKNQIAGLLKRAALSISMALVLTVGGISFAKDAIVEETKAQTLQRLAYRYEGMANIALLHAYMFKDYPQAEFILRSRADTYQEFVSTLRSEAKISELWASPAVEYAPATESR